MMMYINLTVMVAVLVRRCQELEGNLSKFRDQANTIRELLRTKVSVKYIFQELEGNLSKFRDQANTIRELLRTKVSVHLSSSFSVCELSHVLLLFGIIPKLLKLKILFHNFVQHMYCHTWASMLFIILHTQIQYVFLWTISCSYKKNADLRHTYFSPSHEECEVVLWRFQTLQISKFLLLLLSISIRYF